MLYPGGVGGPAARPIPFPSRLRLASALSKYARNLDTEFFRKNIGDLGDVRWFPPSSPRGRLGFAEGKTEPTSVFVRIRAPEGSEGSQKINK